MRLMGFIVALAMAIAALKLAAAVVALLIVGGLLWSAITRPKATFGWVACFALISAVEHNPIVGLMALISLVALGTCGKK